MAFFRFFRMGEITSHTTDGQHPGHCVTMVDVAVDDHQPPLTVRNYLRKSKTDQDGRGVDIYMGKFCPTYAALGLVQQQRQQNKASRTQ